MVECVPLREAPSPVTVTQLSDIMERLVMIQYVILDFLSFEVFLINVARTVHVPLQVILSMPAHVILDTLEQIVNLDHVMP